MRFEQSPYEPKSCLKRLNTYSVELIKELAKDMRVEAGLKILVNSADSLIIIEVRIYYWYV
jgi:hypothetical protein